MPDEGSEQVRGLSDRQLAGNPGGTDQSHQRLWQCDVNIMNYIALTLEVLETWGTESVRLFAFEAN